MGAAPRGVLFLAAVSAILMAIAAANAADGEAAASVVVGLAKCAECTRKNMKTEEAFKGLQVLIKCKNGDGEYESKASGELESSGAFSIPLAADLRRGDCFAQLHSAASSAPCAGQEPSKIMPLSSDGGGKNTFVAVAGEVHRPSTECASAFLCDPIWKHFFDYFHKKPVPPKPDPKPDTPKPKPEPSPNSGNAPPSPSPPSYGGH